MSVITQALILLSDMALRPGRAFARISQPGWRVGPAVLIYIFSTTVHSVFYSLKPVDFPSESAQVLKHALSPWQWLGAELLWGTLFMAAWFLFFLFFLGISRSGNLPLKLGFALMLTALPLALIACQVENGVRAGALAGIWGAVAGLSGFAGFRLQKHFPHGMLKPLISLFLSATAVTLFIIPLQIAAVHLNWENGYIAALYIGGFWILGLCAAGIRAITGTGLARNVLALVLSVFLNMEMLLSLSMGGLVPKNIMKIMFVP